MNMESREKNKKFGFKRFLRSFKFSYDGLKYAYRFEQSMTLHLVCTILVIILGIWLQISPLEWAVCIIGVGLIMALELLNTAIEAVVDLASPEIHPLAKIVKDTASAAIGMYCLIAFIAGCFIFGPKIIALL